MKHKGWLALDIDGTLTHGMYTIPKKVINYLNDKYLEGWKILIVTGRSYHFASLSVNEIEFPFILSTQNGSAAWAMPDKTPLFKKFFNHSIFSKIDKESEDHDIAMLIHGDDYKWYYKKNDKHLSYIDSMAALNNNEAVSFDSYDQLNHLNHFPLIKVIGKYDQVKLFSDIVDEKKCCESSLIKDPFHDGFYILLLTEKGVSKGSCIDEMIAMYGKSVVIAAGNDRNDISMFEKADISVVMADAPESVLQYGDVIAPPAAVFGIIEGLEMAIEKALSKKPAIAGQEK